jgi:hypothetical protein
MHFLQLILSFKLCPCAGQNRLLALNYIFPGDDAAVCAAHAAWGEAFQALHAGHLLPEVTPAERDTTPGRRLRVRCCQWFTD